MSPRDWQAVAPRPALVAVYADGSGFEAVPVLALAVERMEAGSFETLALVLDEQRRQIVSARERERRDGLGRRFLGLFEREDERGIDRAVTLAQARGGVE